MHLVFYENVNANLERMKETEPSHTETYIAVPKVWRMSFGARLWIRTHTGTAVILHTWQEVPSARTLQEPVAN